MKNIAFISLGPESHKNAKYLVKSIKKYCKDYKIIQISRKVDPRIPEVDYKIEYNFKSNKLMIDKLKILSEVFKKFGTLFFLDSDMLITKNLNEAYKLLKINDLIYTSRKSNFKISNQFQNIEFPEFTNKTVNDVMPYNAGFIGINSYSAIKFIEKTCYNLPERFHFWYGDQYAQKIAYDSKRFKINIFDYRYNNSIKDLDSVSEDIYVYHFKGRFKDLIQPFYEKYIKN